MKLTTSAPFIKHFLLLLLLVGVSTPELMGQAQTVGKWTTLSYTMPINPIHVALLHNGKILVVAGSATARPASRDAHPGPPTARQTIPAPFW